MAQAVEEGKEQENAAEQTDSKTQAQTVELDEVEGVDSTGAASSIDILLDMNVNVTATVGKSELSVRRLLQLGPGSVVKLDKPVDSPADLYLKDTKFATGSIVVVDGQFAIRIKQIIGLGGSSQSAEEE